MTSYEVRVWKNRSLLFCLRYDPPIVFRRQNHITFILIKAMSHDLLVQMAYYLLFLTPSSQSARDGMCHKCRKFEQSSRWRFAIWDPGLLLTKSASSTRDLGGRLDVLLAIWVSATPEVCVRKNLYCLSKDDYLWRKACERTSFGPKESEAVVFVLRLNDLKCEKKLIQTK